MAYLPQSPAQLRSLGDIVLLAVAQGVAAFPGLLENGIVWAILSPNGQDRASEADRGSPASVGSYWEG